MPPNELVIFTHKVIDRFDSGAYVGWAGFIMVTFGWWYHVRKIMAAHQAEVHRIGSEKSAAQDRAAGKPFKGSRPRSTEKVQ